MRRALQLLFTLALSASLVLLALVEPALAKTSDFGANLGAEVRSWASALLLGTATLVGLPAVAKREVGEGAKIGVLVAILGGFVFAAPTIKNVINSLWQAMV